MKNTFHPLTTRLSSGMTKFIGICRFIHQLRYLSFSYHSTSSFIHWTPTHRSIGRNMHGLLSQDLPAERWHSGGALNGVEGNLLLPYAVHNAVKALSRSIQWKMQQQPIHTLRCWTPHHILAWGPWMHWKVFCKQVAMISNSQSTHHVA